MIHLALLIVALVILWRPGLCVLGFILGFIAGIAEGFNSRESRGGFLAIAAIAAVCIVLAIAF
jgi:hypothetical protein